MSTAASWPPILLAGLAFYGLFGTWLDTVLLIVITAWNNKSAILERVPDGTQEVIRNGLVGLPGLITGFLVFQIMRFLLVRPEDTKPRGVGKPLFIPCITTHTRLFPKKHSFRYSYLTVGVPVDWNGHAGGMISSGTQNENYVSSMLSLLHRSKAWFDVDPGDYLWRGQGELGLRGKLDAYLTDEVGTICGCT
jgi:hypothetical protein